MMRDYFGVKADAILKRRMLRYCLVLYMFLAVLSICLLNSSFMKEMEGDNEFPSNYTWTEQVSRSSLYDTMDASQPDKVTPHTDDFYSQLHYIRLRQEPQSWDSSAYFRRDAFHSEERLRDALNTPGVERVSTPSTAVLDEVKMTTKGIREHLNVLVGERAHWESWKLYTVPRKKATTKPQHPWRTFYIALNLWKNENIIPHLTGALVAFLEDEVAPFFSVRSSVVVTIFSNDSPDLTAELIKEFMIPRLQKAGVEKIYATVGGECLGHRSRQRFHDRIEWLSCVRNKAMEPLYDMGMNVFLDDPLSGGPAAAGDSLVVLFFNDIYFRAEDITTLLETKPDPDMSVGEPIDGVAVLEEEPQLEPPTSFYGGFDMACAMDYYYSLYDTWVIRDARGGNIFPFPPYTSDRASQNVLLSSSDCGGRCNPGQYGIVVKSCWNGVAAIRGRFFLPTEDTSIRDRMDMFAGRLKGSPASSPPSTAAMRVVLGDGGLYRKDLELLRSKTSGLSNPQWVRRVSGAPYHLSEEIADENNLLQQWLRSVALRVGADWRSREEFALTAHQDHADTARGGPESLMQMILHGEEDNNQELRQRFYSLMQVDFNPAWSDGALFKEFYPSLRFRSAVTPSFGAFTAQKWLEVASDVCKSSECMLICQDIIQMTYIQEHRAAVIVMNPNVRVAYEYKHFQRAQSFWFHSHALIRASKLWMTTYIWALYFLGIDEETSWRKGLSFEGSPERLSASVRDDWMRDEPEVDYLFSPFTRRWVLVNITEMSLMKCSTTMNYESNTIARLFRMTYRCFVVGLIVFLLRCASKASFYRHAARAYHENGYSTVRVLRRYVRVVPSDPPSRRESPLP